MNDEPELNLGEKRGTRALKVLRVKGADLSKAQLEFNRLMKRLELARKRYAEEESRLDLLLAQYVKVVMPAYEKWQRVNLEMVFESAEVIDIIKLSRKRRELFADLICCQAAQLLGDPCGLADEELEKLRGILDHLEGPDDEDDDEFADQDEFDMLKMVIENQAGMLGVDLDLSDLELTDDPRELEQQLRDRLENATGTAKKRKPTKAQLEREKKQQAIEDAKNINFKGLFKQLAKLLHPDLETDHAAKLHKEAWMKRLTTAYEAGDLREMLQIEMEWLGGMKTELARASDEKLLSYNMVLKEQISELTYQIQTLRDSPKYHVMMRFEDRFYDELGNPRHVKKSYEEEVRRHEILLRTLRARDANTKKAVNQWADAHERQLKAMSAFPF